MGGVSVDNLNRDISSLIDVSKADFGVTPWDSNIQARLKALLDLQTVLRTQQLPQDQLILIQNQVNQLSLASQASRHHALASTPIPQPVVSAPSPAPAQASSVLQSILAPGALAALLARQSATPQPSTPQIAAAPLRSPQPSHQVPYQPPAAVAPQSTPAPDPSSLLERLRAAGILGGGLPSTKSPVPAIRQLPVIPPGFPPPPPLHSTPGTGRAILAEIPNDVVLKPASLKM